MTGDVEFFFNHASIESRLYVLPTDDDGELKSTEGTDSFSLASAKDGFSANKQTKLAHILRRGSGTRVLHTFVIDDWLVHD